MKFKVECHILCGNYFCHNFKTKSKFVTKNDIWSQIILWKKMKFMARSYIVPQCRPSFWVQRVWIFQGPPFYHLLGDFGRRALKQKKQVCQGIFGVVTVKALGGKRFWQQVGYGQWTNRETFSKVIHFKRFSILRDQQQQEGRRLQRWKAWGKEVRRVGELRRESKKSWRTHEKK